MMMLIRFYVISFGITYKILSCRNFFPVGRSMKITNVIETVNL
jgi:hypothetical protein